MIRDKQTLKSFFQKWVEDDKLFRSLVETLDPILTDIEWLSNVAGDDIHAVSHISTKLEVAIALTWILKGLLVQ